MRQNGTTISLLLDCVSYEILCETRIKPSFFGNCLISLSSALGQLGVGPLRPLRGHRSALDRAGRREWPRVSEDGEGKLPASPAAPVAIALTGACAPVAGSFLAARP